jgi:hypothetical protein
MTYFVISVRKLWIVLEIRRIDIEKIAVTRIKGQIDIPLHFPTIHVFIPAAYLYKLECIRLFYWYRRTAAPIWIVDSPVTGSYPLNIRSNRINFFTMLIPKIRHCGYNGTNIKFDGDNI